MDRTAPPIHDAPGLDDEALSRPVRVLRRPDEALFEQVAAAYHRGAKHLAAIQREDGCVVGEVVWCPMLTAQYVMTAHMTSQSIPEERRALFIRHFEVWQQPDGSWGMHAESEGYVYVTTLVYVALRLLGLAADSGVCERGLAWLRRQGGVEHIPSWGKLWLAMINLYDWSAVPPVPPEMWLQPKWSPFHPRRFYCHTRLIYLAMSYLFGVKFQAPLTPIISELRDELFAGGFARVNFRAHRFELAPTDTFEVPHRVIRFAYRALGLYERVHLGSLRNTALAEILERIVFHQRESRYAAISPVNGLLNTLALHHAGHPDFAASFAGVDYWSWVDEAEGERFNGAHSHTWDTAFAVQAVCDGPVSAELSEFMEGAGRYFTEHQMRQEVPGREEAYRDQRYGGFCFSDKHHQWPVSDCTAEALVAIVKLSEHVDAKVLPNSRLQAAAAQFLLTRQNADGGWGSYERQRGGLFLDRFNPSEMFGNCMVEHSYVECTAACMASLRAALDHRLELFDHGTTGQIERAIGRGERFLRDAQADDGSWPGFWGVNYLYGTLFGITGLLAAGAPKHDQAISLAREWILAARLPDGGWGESYRGCVEGRYIPHERSQVIMTSWALMALHRAGYSSPEARDAVGAGLRLLVDRQLADGSWPKEGVGGVFFNTAMHHYSLYKDYFSVWALGLFARSTEGLG